MAEATSTSRRKELTWNEITTILTLKIKYELYMVHEEQRRKSKGPQPMTIAAATSTLRPPLPKKTPSVGIKYRQTEFEAQLIQDMLNDGASQDKATNSELQRNFFQDQRIQEIRRKTVCDWISHLAHFMVNEPGSHHAID